MGEAIWCDVKVRVPDRWAPICLEAMDGVLLNGSTFEEVSASTIVDLHWSGEGNYGLFDHGVLLFLDWCELWHVPYVASSDPKYEYEGETRVFDGHMKFSGTSFSENAALTKAEYDAIVDGSSEFRSVEHFFELMNMTEAPMNSDLGDFPPPDPDDRSDNDLVPTRQS